MKGTLEFDLYEERHEFETAVNAGRLLSALCELSRMLRSKIKYEDLSEVEAGIWEEVREKFWDIVRDEEVADLL